MSVFGTLHIIPPSNKKLHRIIKLDAPVTLDRLTQAVGGPVKLISGFNSILRDGKPILCFAFCNENADALGLEQNTWANLLWLQALIRMNEFCGECAPQTVRGPVALLWDCDLNTLSFSFSLSLSLGPLHS